jgi:primosomal protein N'
MNTCPSCDSVEMILATTHECCCPACGYSEAN